MNFAYKLSLANYLFNTYKIFTKWASKNQGAFRGHFLKWQWSLRPIFIYIIIITWRQIILIIITDGARTCVGRIIASHPEMETLAGIFWHFKYFHVVLELNLYCPHAWSPQLNCKLSLTHLQIPWSPSRVPHSCCSINICLFISELVLIFVAIQGFKNI